MFKRFAILGLLAATLAGTGRAQVRSYPHGIPHFDHVFLIMMENHGFEQVINNPNEPYLNSLIAQHKVNLATNYFAIGHPSLTNYFEVVGGSNFGVRSDNPPDWGNESCTPNIASEIVNADNAGGNAPVPFESGKVCPISGFGVDAATPAVDNWNEVELPQFPYLADIDGVKSVAKAPTEGVSIADQLAEAGMRWKTYQESLPLGNIFGVNYSNGTATNLTNFSNLTPLTTSSIVQAYAVKHNPFAYFKSVQQGYPRNNTLKNVVGFDGPNGLFADLATGNVPDFAFISPNQCNDQHGRGNGDAFCGFDFGVTGGLTEGTQAGLNPGLMLQGDVTIERLVESIKASPAWHDRRSAIVIVWDENDYSGIGTAPSGLFPPQNQNKVVLTVETSEGRDHDRDHDHYTLGIQSNVYYNSFSLLKSLEAAFGLPCLNHACDTGISVMSDLFGGH